MTPEELDALPEDGLFGLEEREINGQTVRVPVMQSVGALWADDHDAFHVVDNRDGSVWMVGRGPDGVMRKRRTWPTAPRLNN